MPKVRILHGSQTGGVVDLERAAAESAIASGAGELVEDVAPGEAPAPEPVVETSKKIAKPAAKTHDAGGRATD